MMDKNKISKTLKPGDVLFIGDVEITVEKRATLQLRVPPEISVCGPPRANCKKPIPRCAGELKKKLGWEG